MPDPAVEPKVTYGQNRPAEESLAESENFMPFVQAVGRGAKLRRDLTFDEAVQAMRLILRGEASQAQMGAFLIAQRVKGEAETEIRGFAHVAREEFIQRIAPRVENLLDLGLPYDGKAKTAQLVPAIAVILAVCGVPVLMHGDEGVPAKKGVTAGGVLRALGVADLPPEKVASMLEKVGFGYLSAALFAPAWHALIPLRCEFGLRTALNSVEKLFNPADAPYQISGFFHGEYLERLRQSQTGTRASWIVQGEEGSIEMASGRATHIFAREESDDWILDPALVGLPARERLSLPPDVKQHAGLNAGVLAGETGAATEQAVLTAGAILTLLQVASDLADGIRRARQALESGAAQKRLELARGFQG
jgi:anthranilate phosphoribosyltransferase